MMSDQSDDTSTAAKTNGGTSHVDHSVTTVDHLTASFKRVGSAMTWQKLQEVVAENLKESHIRGITSSKCILAILALAYFLSDAIINGVFPVSLPSVEKQFQLTTTECGIIASMIDIGACLALIPTIYLGENITKPRWLGVGVLVCGVGSIIYAIPQFISPQYELGNELTNYCGNVTSLHCNVSSPLKQYKFIFMLAMALCGVGSEYALTIGVSYLDDNVSQKFSSTYHGIFYCGGALGTAVGYFLTGLAMRVYTYPKEGVTIDTGSPLWVGAWWLGYVVGGAALVFACLPIFSLPRFLPGSEILRSNREQRSSQPNTARGKQFIQRFMHLLRNKLFILLSLSVIIHKALLYGFMTYGVKIGVEIYGLTESFAAFGLGSLAICSSVIGFALGGIIVTKFDLTLKSIIIFLCGCYIVSFPPTFGFLLPCPETEFAGATQQEYPGVANPCNAACGCDTDIFAPVCDDTGTTYYSPCHAGCTFQINDTDFGGCNCTTNLNTSSIVSSNQCNESICSNLYPVTAILFVSFFSGFLTSTPSTQAILRSVAFDERTMGLSVTHIGILLGGRMLGRLVFSQSLASACLVSSTECGEVGACRLYDKQSATENLTIVMATGKALSVLLTGLAFLIQTHQSED